MTVAYLDLSRLNKLLTDEIMEVIQDLLQKGDLELQSATVGQFEDAFARHLGARHAVAVGSGSNALFLSLQALGVSPGDEVICPAYGSIETAQAVARIGATIIFVDVNENFTLDLESVKVAVTEKTRAVIGVHTFGLSADIESLAQLASDYGIYLIEDASQACGGQVAGRSLGTFGIAGCFSFSPHRNLSGISDGGMVVTDNDEMAERIRLFRDCGKDDSGRFQVIGYSSYLGAVQAGVLNLKLQSLREDNENRIANASFYDDKLTKDFFQVPPFSDDGSHVYNLYVIRQQQRDAIRSFLAERQVEARNPYPLALHIQPCFEYLGYREGHFPQAEQCSRTALALPIYPGLTRKELDEVAHTLELYAKTHPVAAAS